MDRLTEGYSGVIDWSVHGGKEEINLASATS
jgi:hypothetical protein